MYLVFSCISSLILGVDSVVAKGGLNQRLLRVETHLASEISENLQNCFMKWCPSFAKVPERELYPCAAWPRGFQGAAEAVGLTVEFTKEREIDDSCWV